MNVSTVQSTKQADAAHKRDEALKYLAKEGQVIDSLSSLRKRENDLTQKPKGDNTLYLLAKDKAEIERHQKFQEEQRLALLQKRNSIVKNHHQNRKPRNNDVVAASSTTTTSTSTTLSSPAQSSHLESILPINWKQIADPVSGKNYYWNTVTNETTWTAPVAPPSTSSKINPNEDENDLPEGWIKKIHSATQQVLYYHGATNRTVGERPSKDSDSYPTLVGNKRTAQEGSSNEDLLHKLLKK